MYKCCDCGTIFRTPIESIERHGLDTPPYEKIVGCPKCFSSDFDPAVVCDFCGEWVTNYYETKDGNFYCENCICYKGR